MSEFRYGYDKEGDPVTYLPDGSYINKHVTGATLRILNDQHQEIQDLKKVIAEIHKDVAIMPELNTSNYDHEQVCELNDSVCNLYIWLDKIAEKIKAEESIREDVAEWE